jgi:hypothetical protein
MFVEPNTAVYDGAFIPFTYLQPMKVTVEKLPAPEAKYYQRLTRKPWDISSTEWMEITARKRYFAAMWYGAMIVVMMFMMPKERSFSGIKGADGYYVNLPTRKPEMFA